MAISIESAPPNPSPGKSGHFEHHLWLKRSVETLSSSAVPTPSSVKEIDVNADAKVVLEAIVDVLVSLGVAKKKKAG